MNILYIAAILKSVLENYHYKCYRRDQIRLNFIVCRLSIYIYVLREQHPTSEIY